MRELSSRLDTESKSILRFIRFLEGRKFLEDSEVGYRGFGINLSADKLEVYWLVGDSDIYLNWYKWCPVSEQLQIFREFGQSTPAETANKILTILKYIKEK